MCSRVTFATLTLSFITMLSLLSVLTVFILFPTIDRIIGSHDLCSHFTHAQIFDVETVELKCLWDMN